MNTQTAEDSRKSTEKSASLMILINNSNGIPDDKTNHNYDEIDEIADQLTSKPKKVRKRKTDNYKKQYQSNGSITRQKNKSKSSTKSKKDSNTTIEFENNHSSNHNSVIDKNKTLMSDMNLSVKNKNSLSRSKNIKNCTKKSKNIENLINSIPLNINKTIIKISKNEIRKLCPKTLKIKLKRLKKIKESRNNNEKILVSNMKLKTKKQSKILETIPTNCKNQTSNTLTLPEDEQVNFVNSPLESNNFEGFEEQSLILSDNVTDYSTEVLSKKRKLSDTIVDESNVECNLPKKKFLMPTVVIDTNLSMMSETMHEEQDTMITTPKEGGDNQIETEKRIDLVVHNNEHERSTDEIIQKSISKKSKKKIPRFTIFDRKKRTKRQKKKTNSKQTQETVQKEEEEEVKNNNVEELSVSPQKQQEKFEITPIKEQTEKMNTEQKQKQDNNQKLSTSSRRVQEQKQKLLTLQNQQLNALSKNQTISSKKQRHLQQHLEQQQLRFQQIQQQHQKLLQQQQLMQQQQQQRPQQQEQEKQLKWQQQEQQPQQKLKSQKRDQPQEQQLELQQDQSQEQQLELQQDQSQEQQLESEHVQFKEQNLGSQQRQLEEQQLHPQKQLEQHQLKEKQLLTQQEPLTVQYLQSQQELQSLQESQPQHELQLQQQKLQEQELQQQQQQLLSQQPKQVQYDKRQWAAHEIISDNSQETISIEWYDIPEYLYVLTKTVTRSEYEKLRKANQLTEANSNGLTNSQGSIPISSSSSDKCNSLLTKSDKNSSQLELELLLDDIESIIEKEIAKEVKEIIECSDNRIPIQKNKRQRNKSTILKKLDEFQPSTLKNMLKFLKLYFNNDVKQENQLSGQNDDEIQTKEKSVVPYRKIIRASTTKTIPNGRKPCTDFRFHKIRLHGNTNKSSPYAKITKPNLRKSPKVVSIGLTSNEEIQLPNDAFEKTPDTNQYRQKKKQSQQQTQQQLHEQSQLQTQHQQQLTPVSTKRNKTQTTTKLVNIDSDATLNVSSIPKPSPSPSSLNITSKNHSLNDSIKAILQQRKSKITSTPISKIDEIQTKPKQIILIPPSTRAKKSQNTTKLIKSRATTKVQKLDQSVTLTPIITTAITENNEEGELILPDDYVEENLLSHSTLSLTPKSESPQSSSISTFDSIQSSTSKNISPLSIIKNESVNILSNLNKKNHHHHHHHHNVQKQQQQQQQQQQEDPLQLNTYEQSSIKTINGHDENQYYSLESHGINNSYSYKCDKCNKNFVTKLLIHEHLQNNHFKHLNDHCYICNQFMGAGTAQFLDHFLLNHPEKLN